MQAPNGQPTTDQPRQRFVNRETDVDVPRQQAQIIALAWAIVVTLAIGSTVGLICWLKEQPTVPTILLSVLLGSITGGISFVILYALNVTAFMGQQRRLLMGMLEEATGQDINQDGYIGTPPSQTVRVEVVWMNQKNNITQMVWSDWPMTAEQVPLFARAILAGKTAEGNWGGDAFLTRPDFTKTRGILIERG